MAGDPFFDVRIIAFGTHLSSFHGHTIDNILLEGFTIDYSVESVMASDTAAAIATSMALTSMKFAAIWAKEKNNYDLVFCLGDRYEMFAAVSAGTPFGIRFAHIHGGETTLGAIDDQFRHCLSIFSRLHFTATEQYAERVKDIIGSSDNIYAVGAVSLDNLQTLALLSEEEFFNKYGIDIRKPTILVTFHPETVASERNEGYAKELVAALRHFKNYQIIITMPNADTRGSVMRNVYNDFATDEQPVYLIENFGTLGYFSCMKYSKVMVGNSSSGIIEAASFQKYVVDIGNRQKGRAVSRNIIHAEPDTASIIQACEKALSLGAYTGENSYYKGGAVHKIIEVLKNATIRNL